MYAAQRTKQTKNKPEEKKTRGGPTQVKILTQFWAL